MGLPVLSQTGAGGPASPITGDSWGRPIYFGEAAEAFPRLNFILAHFGQGYIPDVIKLSARHERIHYDTTAISTSRIGQTPEWSLERTASLFRLVGIDRVVFGTNFPISQQREHDAEVIESLGLTDDENRRIFYENAVRILDHSRVPSAPAPAGGH
jgi:predicted TIM-barrel fold metal-dependent hydrolase